MTDFKQSNLYNGLTAKGNAVSVPLESDLTQSQIDSDFDWLPKGKEEAIRWEKIGLLEDQFVKAVCRQKVKRSF